MKDEAVVIIFEAEDFGNGWCILPVLVEKEAKMKAAWQNGYADYPEMACSSGGRYRYSGAKVTGLVPVSEIAFPVLGGYALWARSRCYAVPDMETYVVTIEDWKSGKIEHFVECIREYKLPRVTGEDGKAALAICLAVKESVRTHRPVMLQNVKRELSIARPSPQCVFRERVSIIES